jgi:large subunit ribosomal protein L21
LTFGEVLMVGDGDKTQIGAPLVGGASVAAEIVEQSRGPKIIIFKKRRRHNYRRRNGHRQDLTTIRITEILLDGKAPAKPTKKDDAAPAGEELAPMFDAPSGPADDLKKISGVGPVLEKKLNALGITTYAQVAAFSEEDIERVDDVLNFKGRIARENWPEQAAKLAVGSEETDGDA